MKEASELYIAKERRFLEKDNSLYLYSAIDGDVTMETIMWLSEKENNEYPEHHV